MEHSANSFKLKRTYNKIKIDVEFYEQILQSTFLSPNPIDDLNNRLIEFLEDGLENPALYEDSIGLVKWNSLYENCLQEYYNRDFTRGKITDPSNQSPLAPVDHQPPPDEVITALRQQIKNGLQELRIHFNQKYEYQGN